MSHGANYNDAASAGTVLNINTTAGTKFEVTLYMVSGVQPNASAAAQSCPSKGMVSSPCTATKQVRLRAPPRIASLRIAQQRLVMWALWIRQSE